MDPFYFIFYTFSISHWAVSFENLEQICNPSQHPVSCSRPPDPCRFLPLLRPCVLVRHDYVFFFFFDKWLLRPTLVPLRQQETRSDVIKDSSQSRPSDLEFHGISKKYNFIQATRERRKTCHLFQFVGIYQIR